MKKSFTLLFVIGLASCAAPKATVVAEEAPVKPVEKNAVADISPPISVAGDPNDGLRIGDDILALPSDEQLRASPTPSGGGTAPVIVRPPKD